MAKYSSSPASQLRAQICSSTTTAVSAEHATDEATILIATLIDQVVGLRWLNLPAINRPAERISLSARERISGTKKATGGSLVLSCTLAGGQGKVTDTANFIPVPFFLSIRFFAPAVRELCIVGCIVRDSHIGVAVSGRHLRLPSAVSGS